MGLRERVQKERYNVASKKKDQIKKHVNGCRQGLNRLVLTTDPISYFPAKGRPLPMKKPLYSTPVSKKYALILA